MVEGKEGRSYLLIRVLISPPSLGDEAGSWFLFMYVCMCACVCVCVCVRARSRVWVVGCCDSVFSLNL